MKRIRLKTRLEGMLKIVTVFLLLSISAPTFSQQLHQVALNVNQPPQLIADAGEQNITNSEVVSLGGSPSASGGTQPYTYSWTPTNNLSGGAVANPTINATNNVTQLYTLTVTDSKGCTASDQVQVNIVITSVEGKDAGIMIYPNPVKDILLIESLVPIHHYTLIDGQGRTVADEAVSGSKVEIKLSFLQSGMYSLIVHGEGKAISKKIIVEIK